MPNAGINLLSAKRACENSGRNISINHDSACTGKYYLRFQPGGIGLHVVEGKRSVMKATAMKPPAL